MRSERLPIFGLIFNRSLICESYGIKRKLRSRIRFVLLRSTHRLFKSKAPIQSSRWGLLSFLDKLGSNSNNLPNLKMRTASFETSCVQGRLRVPHSIFVNVND